MLRLTETIGNLGATASETSLASLAVTESATQRRQKFNHCWLYVALFCLPGALIFGFQGKWLLHLWFARQGFVGRRVWAWPFSAWPAPSAGWW